MKRKNHDDVHVCSSDDSVHVTECGGVLELHHSPMCLLLVAVESGEFVHLDLNCNKALSLGILHKIHLAVRSDGLGGFPFQMSIAISVRCNIESACRPRQTCTMASA